MNELVKNARLADAGLAQNRYNLPAPRGRLRKRPAKHFHFGVPSYESREAACDRGLQPRMYGPGPDDLEDLDWRS